MKYLVEALKSQEYVVEANSVEEACALAENYFIDDMHHTEIFTNILGRWEEDEK